MSDRSSHRLAPLRRLARDTAKRVGFPLGLRLASFEHHPPRPMRLPDHYANTPLPEDGPSFLIATPSLNQAAFLPRTIRSVLDQHYPRLHYTVQDGGSTDGSVAAMERFAPDWTHWRSEPDHGQTHAINLGLHRLIALLDQQQPHGDPHQQVMAYLNADDQLLPGTLRYVAAFFAAHPEIDAVYGHRIILDSHGQQVGRWTLPPYRRGHLLWACYVPQETLFWRRSLWERTGGRLDETFQFAMDWELIARFEHAGARFARLPRYLAAFTTHPDQKSIAIKETRGRAEFERVRQRFLPYRSQRLGARLRSYAHLLESVGWHWAETLGLKRF